MGGRERECEREWEGKRQRQQKNSFNQLIARMQDRTIGTSYYYSSLNYLGYSPFSESYYQANYETKPFAAFGPEGSVSLYLFNFFFNFYFQQTYKANPLSLYITLRQCLEQEIQLVKQEVCI